MTTRDRIVRYFAVTVAAVIVFSVLSASVSAVVGIVRFAKEKKAERIRRETGGVVTITDLEDLRSLTLTAGLTALRIREGEPLSLSYAGDAFTSSFQDGRLTLKPVPGVSGGEAPVCLTLPKGMELDDVFLSAGGNVLIDALCATRMELTFGGDAEIGALTAFSSAYLESGAGNVKISGGYLNDLTLKGGAGDLTLASTLTGQSAVTSYGGKLTLRLRGKTEDYAFLVQGGNVTINTVAADPIPYGSGAARVTLNGEYGPVEVTIEE